MGASAVTAATLCAVSISSALSYAPKTLQQREFAQRVAEQVLARQGISVSVPLPANPGFDWAGTITPAVIALLLIGLIIFLRVRRADRFQTERRSRERTGQHHVAGELHTELDLPARDQNHPRSARFTLMPHRARQPRRGGRRS
jgi:hypothetical protein